jgi:N-acyl-D-aspartate/D-glutamate deacylase
LESTGIISPGKKADITVFSPDDIDSKANFQDPHKFADGIIMTMLDGEPEFY